MYSDIERRMGGTNNKQKKKNFVREKDFSFEKKYINTSFFGRETNK